MLLEVFHVVLLWSALTSLLVLLKAGICLKFIIFYLKFYRKKKLVTGEDISVMGLFVENCCFYSSGIMNIMLVSLLKKK